LSFFVQIGFFIISFAQLFAIQDYFGGGFFAFFLALFVTGIPILGTVLGVLGAHDVWGWSWMQATMLYVLPMALIFVYAAFASIFDRE
jgi:hypothetical protein